MAVALLHKNGASQQDMQLSGLTCPDVELGKVIFVSQVQDEALKVTGVAL